MAIPAQQARSIFTKELVRIYDQVPAPTMFLKNFFRTSTTDAKEVSVEVFRGTEKVAVDIMRGSRGNRNAVSKSTERIYKPPYYDEPVDATSIDAYDDLAGKANTTAGLGRFIAGMAPKLQMLRDKISRAYELQASQAFFDGIIQLNSGDNIDYKRKAGSLVDKGGSGYWVPANSTVSPLDDLQAGCQFIRKNGKYSGGVFNAVMGTEAFNAMLAMPLFKEKADFRRVNIVDINGPLKNNEGGNLHGTVNAGSYTVNIWTYDEYYNDPSTGTLTPYVPANKVLILPNTPSFDFAFAGTPYVFDTGNAAVPQIVRTERGEYNPYEYVDQYESAHIFGVRSAGVAILTAVDQVYTVQVLS